MSTDNHRPQKLFKESLSKNFEEIVQSKSNFSLNKSIFREALLILNDKHTAKFLS